ncbi:MAG: glycosyl hydrolase [Rhodocyclaceae bacterium]|nr:glycosyl hydrolase [Rhodocyclaceae bacterium]
MPIGQHRPAARPLAGWLASLAPIVIIGGLLYAAFFVQVAPELPAVEQPAVGPRDRFYGVTAIDGQLWAVGALGKVVTSDDGGTRWRVQPTPLRTHLQGIAAWDARRLVAVGNAGAVLVSADGGARWEAVDTPAADGRKFLRVRAFEPGVAWATGEYGMVLSSTDYGHSWQEMMPAEDVGWNDVAVRDGRILVVGEFGRIARSDGGGQWQDVPSGVESSLTSVWLGPGLALAVGLDGHVLRSTDGGASWQPVPSGTREHLFSIEPGEGGFVAVGNRGVVLRGSADGTRWQAGRATDSDFAWRTSLARSDGHWVAAGQRLGPIHPPGT